MEMNNNTQNEIEDLIKGGNGELLELSDYIMNKDDGWITKSKFLQIIREHTSKTKDTYVVGFSELIRFYSRKEIESVVLSLFDIENENIMEVEGAQRRIYFICFSMMDNVYSVLKNSFARKDLIDPFINSDYEFSGEYREVCFVSNDYSEKIIRNKITTSVEWIGLWRHSEIIDFTAPIWCCSESLYEWYEKASPDNAFQIDEVRSVKDYLRKVYDIEVDFEYFETEDSYWNQLCREFTKCGQRKTLPAMSAMLLNVDVGSTSALAGKWLVTESLYEKWFIKNYALSYMQNTYLYSVFKLQKTNSQKEFLVSIWKQGYWTSDAEQLEERLEIIKELNKYASFFIPEYEIQDVINEGVARELCIDKTESEKLSKIHLFELCKENSWDYSAMREHLWSYYIGIFKPAYTGLSNAEKEFVINLVSNGLMDKAELKLVYPSLYYYLYGQYIGNLESKEEWTDYLQAYRESKVTGRDTSYLKQFYFSGQANATNLYNMYYTLERQETIIAPYVTDSDIYILDGVGAEYLPLMVELIRQNGYDIELCDYAACHLPSITDINQEYLAEIPYKEWFLDFDRNVIHGEYYKTAINLRKAFDILESKIKDIILESGGNRIVITADHGATARARWTDTKKKYDFSGVDHEGRCCKVSANSVYEDTEDYIIYEDEIKPGKPYMIALNDTSLCNRPKYEDHGGATIEEVLVPVIVAVPNSTEKEVDYKVISNNLEVDGINKSVSFVIIPDLEQEGYVVESDMTKHVLKKDNGVYVAELKTGKTQHIKVLISNREFEFRTINRAKRNMEGDDGFDD